MSRWILLRGLVRESRHWGDFPALFARQMPAAELLLPDLPGNGYLHGCRSPLRVGEMVEHFRETALVRGFTPPYHLLALSLGGMIATEWAHRYPDELHACVLMNTSMRPFSPFHKRLKWRNYPDLLRLVAMQRDPHAFEQQVLRLTSNCHEVHAAVSRTWARYREECPVSRRNALRQLFAAAVFCAPAQKPRVPVLVLAGGKDGLVDPACSWCLAQQWNASLAIHPDAGHDLPLDDGTWVATRIRDWIGTLAADGCLESDTHGKYDIA